MKDSELHNKLKTNEKMRSKKNEMKNTQLNREIFKKKRTNTKKRHHGGYIIKYYSTIEKEKFLIDA